MRCDQWQINIARFLDSFAAVHGFEHGQLARLFLDQTRNPKKVFSALAARHLRPDIFVRASRRFYREINIPFIRGTNLRQFLFRGRINGIKILARLRRHESAVDEKLIAVAQFNVPVRFPRWRVTPTLAEIQTSFCDRLSVGPAVSIDNRELRAVWFPSRHKIRVRKNNQQYDTCRRTLYPLA